MLREVKNARVERRLLRYVLTLSGEPRATIARSDLRTQASHPVPVLTDDDRRYWAFEQRIYWEDSDLSAAASRSRVRSGLPCSNATAAAASSAARASTSSTTT
jgi:hypothetical protein